MVLSPVNILFLGDASWWYPPYGIWIVPSTVYTGWEDYLCRGDRYTAQSCVLKVPVLRSRLQLPVARDILSTQVTMVTVIYM